MIARKEPENGCRSVLDQRPQREHNSCVCLIEELDSNRSVNNNNGRSIAVQIVHWISMHSSGREFKTTYLAIISLVIAIEPRSKSKEGTYAMPSVSSWVPRSRR